MKEIDKTILALQNKVEEKKAQLNKNKKLSWNTNCRLLVNGSAMNIQALTSVNDCVSAYASLIKESNAYMEAARRLGVECDINPKYQGFSLTEWEEDFKTRIVKIREVAERASLKSLEEKLAALESEELRTQKALEDIKKALDI